MLLTGVALASWSVVPGIVGLEPTTVMSGSMTPRFQVGDAVITRPVAREDLAVGQVLLFDDPDAPGELRMHRLVAARGDRLTTQGDANEAADSSPVRFDAVHGVGVVRVPFAGLPVYWLRTHRYPPLIACVLVAVVLAVGSRLDRRFSAGRHIDEDAPRARRRLPKHLLRPIAPVVLLAALCFPAAEVSPPAQAGFVARTTNPTSTFTGCWDYPVRGTLPASALAYFNYMETSGMTTVNRVVPGTSVNMFGTVTRRAGSCTVNGSPYITVGSQGASGLIAGTASSVPSAITIATWFKTSVASGTIADIGDNGSGGPSGASNVVLYMNTDGAVVLGAVTSQALGIPLGGMTCRSPNGYANDQWHLVVATLSSTAGCTIGIDGAVPVAGSAAVNSTAVNLQLLSGFSGYWRLGYDALPSFWPKQGSTAWFQGDLDESQVYSAVLTTTEQATIFARRR